MEKTREVLEYMCVVDENGDTQEIPVIVQEFYDDEVDED